MPGFEAYTCEHCGDGFVAHPSANAAGGYCSPRCESAGRELA